MREIKFRAWDKGLKKMWNWKELKYLPMVDFKREELEWQQFIGLFDKNGKEIYEGDIINKAQPYEVVFFQSGFCIHGFSKKGDEFWQMLDTWIDENDNTKLFKYEVIGNIYENPELLKK
jgi:uncharacterized phage protein (TIGR01671 family)